MFDSYQVILNAANDVIGWIYCWLFWPKLNCEDLFAFDCAGGLAKGVRVVCQVVNVLHS